MFLYIHLLQTHVLQNYLLQIHVLQVQSVFLNIPFPVGEISGNH